MPAISRSNRCHSSPDNRALAAMPATRADFAAVRGYGFPPKTGLCRAGGLNRNCGSTRPIGFGARRRDPRGGALRPARGSCRCGEDRGPRGLWMAIFGLVVLGYFALTFPDTGELTRAERRPSVTMLAADGCL